MIAVSRLRSMIESSLNAGPQDVSCRASSKEIRTPIIPELRRRGSGFQAAKMGMLNVETIAKMRRGHSQQGNIRHSQ
ncbi:hypothetical protein [Sphingobium sp. Cam5-1]|uniref:hypothetical protein n=1 Tax=Sphingobium sp. Cam5-1 TaxID=2789327 RepID=UPI0018AD1B3F|nr:hypothetical protein [Sphingobium sp. Cam5-1]QPI75569.1 hypothetical protein IZV00_19150 [Sphingobium sp. Cam5-1]